MSTAATITANPQVLPPITVAAVSKSNFLSTWFHAFVNFFKKSPTWVHIAQTVLPFAIIAANLAMSDFAPELIPIAQPIEAEVQADLTTLTVLAKQGAATTSFTDALTRLQSNFSTIATTLHIKDQATLQTINTVLTQLSLLASMVQPTTQADPTPASTPGIQTS